MGPTDRRFKASPLTGDDGALLSAPQVAQRCSVSKSTAQRWMSDPAFPICRIGGVVRVRAGDLDRWIAAHVRVPL